MGLPASTVIQSRCWPLVICKINKNVAKTLPVGLKWPYVLPERILPLERKGLAKRNLLRMTTCGSKQLLRKAKKTWRAAKATVTQTAAILNTCCHLKRSQTDETYLRWMSVTKEYLQYVQHNYWSAITRLREDSRNKCYCTVLQSINQLTALTLAKMCPRLENNASKTQLIENETVTILFSRCRSDLGTKTSSRFRTQQNFE